MIPLGILSQSTRPDIVFINFNGSYFETTYPSTPTWPAGYTEYEYRFTTTSAAIGPILSGPVVPISEIGATIEMESNQAGSNSRIENTPTNSAVRINRSISFLPSLVLKVSLPPQYNTLKVHCIGLGSGSDGYSVAVMDNSTFKENVQGSVAGNIFSYSPYDAGSDWQSSSEVTISSGSLRLNVAPLDEFTYCKLNAMAIEIL